MRESLTALFESFCKNRETVKKAFAWERAELYPVCALLFASEGRQATGDELDDCRRLIREKTGLFSNFRSTALPVLASILAVSPDPDARMNAALELHSALRRRFAASQYLPVAAMLLSDEAKDDPDGFAVRTKEIYTLMKKDHPLLTDESDSVFAAMLAVGEPDPSELMCRAEECYGILRKTFRSRDAVQSLSQMLAMFEGDSEEKCAAAVELYGLLTQAGYRYGRDRELALLGVIACLGTPLRSAADDIAAIDDRLAKLKGYGFFGMSRRERLMHAAMIVATDLSGFACASGGASVGISLSLALAAQHAALCAAITASTVTAVANSAAQQS